MTSPQQSDTSQTSDNAKRTIRNVGALVIASVLSKGILFFWQIILGNWLGVTDYGIYNTVFAVIAVVMPIASFGMGLILIREVARTPDRLGEYWSAVLFMQTGLSAIAYVIAVGGAILAGYSDTIIAFTAIAGISILVDITGSLGSDLLLAREKMHLTSMVEIAQIIIRVALSALALALNTGLLGVYIATIATGLVRTSILWWLNWRDDIRPSFPIERSIAWRVFLDSLPLAIAAVLTLAYQHADKLMTTAFIGETNTGYLGPAFVINFGVIEILSTTILVAIYPMMARYYSDGKSRQFGSLVEKLAIFTMLVSLPIALVLSIFADGITALLFSPEFAPTAGILRILIWYTFITMIANIFAQAFLTQNRQNMTLIIRASGLALNIALNAYLLSTWRDPRGAAIASVSAEILILGLMMAQFRAVGLSWRRIQQTAIRVLLWGLCTAIVMILIGQIHFILGAVIGGFIYLIGLAYLPILRADDWDLIYRIVMAMPLSGIVSRFWQRDVETAW